MTQPSAPEADPSTPDSDVQPAGTSPGWDAPSNELGQLSEFIYARQRNTLDLHLAYILRETAGDHALWAGECKASHMYEDFPCEDYERGVHLGIAWLKSLIESHESA